MWSQPGHIVVSDDIWVGNMDLRFGRWNIWQSVAEVKDAVAKLYSTNKQYQQTHVQYQPSISHHHTCFHPKSWTVPSHAWINLTMEDHNLINGEVCRWKRNNTRMRKQEEDRHLIADGDGKISLCSQQDTKFSPVGPRKAKTTALKNASEILGSGTRESVKFLQNIC